MFSDARGAAVPIFKGQCGDGMSGPSAVLPWRVAAPVSTGFRCKPEDQRRLHKGFLRAPSIPENR